MYYPSRSTYISGSNVATNNNYSNIYNIRSKKRCLVGACDYDVFLDFELN